MYDTIIIGAGMSGLAAGVRLAHFDRKVCILERHSVVGGLNSFFKRRGRNFDVGLHALTNYAPPGANRGPLVRMLRQLRLAWDELTLAPQLGSAIRFPGITLRFANHFEVLVGEVRREFPGQVDGLQRLVGALRSYDDFAADTRPSREVLAEYLSDPLLAEMLLCPVLFYGGHREHDIPFGSFSVMFRSIFLEGLARPAAGVRLLLGRLVERFKSHGGELRLRAGVSRLVVEGDRVTKVVLDDGTELLTKHVLSSAGWPETRRLCDEPAAEAESAARLTFVESIAVLDRPPKALGHDLAIVFFNDSETLDYRQPAGEVDVRSGIICAPSNFAYAEPLGEHQVRVSCLANYDRWAGLAGNGGYQVAKLRWYDRLAASAVRFMPEYRHAVVDTEFFTPTTIQRYTGHDTGSVYGATEKRYDGATHLKNLYLCGNDQGLVGIVGAIVSGVTIANRYLLKD